MLHAGGPPSFTLRSAPAEVRFARCLMEVRTAEGQQRPPRAVCGASGGTEHFPNEGGVVLELCSGDSFGPVGHLGSTDEIEPHEVEQVLLRRVEVPAFAHPATLRGAYPIGQSTRLNAIPSAICRSGLIRPASMIRRNRFALDTTRRNKSLHLLC